MAIEETFQRVERDIAEGDLGKARERLLSLAGRYPENLEVRRRLARIYADLHYPEQAGRYWYLEEEQTEEMRRACDIFERRYGNDPGQILAALGSPKSRSIIASDHAQRVFGDLEQRRLQSGHPPRPKLKRNEAVTAIAPGTGCGAALLVLIFVFIVGLIRIFQLWIEPLIRWLIGPA